MEGGKQSHFRSVGKICLVENKKVGMRTGKISSDHGLSYKEEGKEKIIFHFFFSGNCLIDQKPTHHVVMQCWAIRSLEKVTSSDVRRNPWLSTAQPEVIAFFFFIIKEAHMLSRFSCFWLSVTLWTVALQAPLSMGFYRQEYWSGLPFSPPGDLPDPEIKLVSCISCISCTGRLHGLISQYWNRLAFLE